MALAETLFRLVTVRDYVPPAADEVESDYAERSVPRFLDRFDGRLDFAGKTVLDVGCGLGVLCLEAARRGAAEAVGIDIGGVEAPRRYLRERAPELADRVQFLETDASLGAVAGRQFDLVLSKDSFEHYADPESFIHPLAALVAPGGSLAIGFGPLWKSPTGGHIDFMTKFPWAHLIFPEPVIMRERRRFRPDEDARTFGEIRGGLNKMTLRRFRAIVATSGLECEYFATNVSDSRVVKLMSAISRVPPLREYFTQSVYTILRKPA
jgi:SAM-dependent methyltransferase